MPNALQSALSAVACSPIHTSSWLRVTGDDRVRWLNGMVTNSIQALTAGRGCYNFLLNAQGRIQADCTAWLEPQAILLQTADPASLAALLDRFIIMDDVELEVLSPEARHGLLLAGPAAAETLQGLGFPVPAEPLTFLESGQGTVLYAHSPLIPRYELWSADAFAPELPVLSPQDLAHLRLLEGTPLVGTDIREKDLPQETAQTRALHFAKGCYLGQEIVERIRSRGQVHRTFHGFRLTGELPTGNSPLTLDGKPVGELTSSTLIPLAPPVALAFGFIRREALEQTSPALPITYPGGVAEPVDLPFRPA